MNIKLTIVASIIGLIISNSNVFAQGTSPLQIVDPTIVGGIKLSSNDFLSQIETDREFFLFNKQIILENGSLSAAFNQDLVFSAGESGKTQRTMVLKYLSGNVGIGTNSPDQKLTVAGNVNIGGNRTGELKVRHIDGKSGTSASHGPLFINYSTTNPVYVGRNGNQSDFYVFGDVGIGTSTPTHKLEVNGTIRSKELICEATPWPDYVFTGDYHLRPLGEVEAHIKTNGHLPNIPSAEEVAENGIKLAEMNAKLLEKIEELTLYTIAQEKALESQRDYTQKMESALEALNKKIKIIENQLNTEK